MEGTQNPKAAGSHVMWYLNRRRRLSGMEKMKESTRRAGFFYSLYLVLYLYFVEVFIDQVEDFCLDN